MKNNAILSYEQFIDLVDKTYNSFNWRYGQCIMNVLHTVWKEKHDELMASEDDCYYDDGSVRKTLNNLEKEWLI